MHLTIDIAAASNLSTVERTGSATKKRRTSDESTPPAIQKGTNSAEDNPFQRYRESSHSPRERHPLNSDCLTVLNDPENRIKGSVNDGSAQLKREQAAFFFEQARCTGPQDVQQWIDATLAENLANARSRKNQPESHSLTAQTSSSGLYSRAHENCVDIVSEGAQYKSKKDEDTQTNGSFEIEINGTRFPFSYFCICDGHGGRQTSAYIREHIHSVLLSKVQQLCNKEINKANIYFALHSTFDDLKQKVDEYLRSLAPEELGEKGQGATVNLMVQYDDFIWFANSGDCRVVAMGEGFNQAVQATEDASCTKRRFKEKVESRGGFIGPNNKVNGDVAVPCAIGRYLMRKSGHSQERKPSNVIDHTPTMTRLNLKEYPWIIQATDGLWNVVKTDEIPQLLLEESAKTPGQVAQILKDVAYARWGCMTNRFPGFKRTIDDITVQVTHFKQKRMENV